MNWADRRYCIGRGLAAIRAKPGECETAYLSLALNHLAADVLHRADDGVFPNLDRDALLDFTMPIPKPAEQLRIVARIDALTSRAGELKSLNEGVVDDFSAMLSEEYKAIVSDAPIASLGSVARLVRRPVDPGAHDSFPEVGIRSFGKGTFHKPALSREQLGTKRVFLIKAGDLVFMNVFAWEGAIAVARHEDEGRVASHRFMTHEVVPGKATPEFLCHHFLTETGLEQIRAASPGSAGRNRTLGITKLHAAKVPVPPFKAQQRFSTLVKKLGELRRLQQETEAELDAFTPALLAKAFRGEL